MSTYTVEVEQVETYRVEADSEAEAQQLAASPSGLSNRVQLTAVRVTTQVTQSTEPGTSDG